MWNVLLYSVLMFGDKTRVKIKGSLSTPPLLPALPYYPSARVYVHAISPFALFPTLPRNHNCQLQRAATRVVRFSSSAEETTQHTHIHPRVMYMCGVRVCVYVCLRGGGNPDKTESCYYIHSLGWVVAV